MRTEYIGPGSRPRNARLFERDRRHHYWRHPLSYLQVVGGLSATAYNGQLMRAVFLTNVLSLVQMKIAGVRNPAVRPPSESRLSQSPWCQK